MALKPTYNSFNSNSFTDNHLTRQPSQLDLVTTMSLLPRGIRKLMQLLPNIEALEEKQAPTERLQVDPTSLHEILMVMMFRF